MLARAADSLAVHEKPNFAVVLRVAQGKLEEDESMARRAGADAEGTSSEAVPERPPPPYGTGTEEDDST